PTTSSKMAEHDASVRSTSWWTKVKLVVCNPLVIILAFIFVGWYCIKKRSHELLVQRYNLSESMASTVVSLTPTVMFLLVLAVHLLGQYGKWQLETRQLLLCLIYILFVANYNLLFYFSFTQFAFDVIYMGLIFI